MQRKDWAARVDGLVVFRGLLQSEPLASLRAALAADAAGLTGAVAAFESALLTQGTNWTEVLLDAVLEDENLCLRTAAGGDAGPVLEKALDRACAVPLEVMTACGEGIALAAEYAEKGSVLARSDAGCAALFCKAAMQAAGLNVKVNTRLMADKAHADALEARAEQLLAEFVPQADTVYQTVSNE